MKKTLKTLWISFIIFAITASLLPADVLAANHNSAGKSSTAESFLEKSINQRYSLILPI